MTTAVRRDGVRKRKIRRRFGAALIPLLAPSLLRLLRATWRVERLGAANFEKVRATGGALFAIWHGRMIVALAAHHGAGFSVLVSTSDDGSLVIPPLIKFGYTVIRGSTNKGGVRALREMLGQLVDGGSVVITPDGPRGPRHSMNDGLAWMAKATGYPVVPCGLTCDRAWRLSSWDRFTIPKFGARIAVVYGEPLWLDKGASKTEQRAFTDRIRGAMIAAETQGFAHLGVSPDFDPLTGP